MTDTSVPRLTLYVDGAAKGNPGPAGLGVRVEADGQVITEVSDYLGEQTNNAAEYHALIRGLEAVQVFRPDEVNVISDSELIVRQMRGEYRVKNPKLFPLYEKARALSDQFDRFSIHHVPRAQNVDADRLANEGITKGQASGASGSDGCA